MRSLGSDETVIKLALQSARNVAHFITHLAWPILQTVLDVIVELCIPANDHRTQLSIRQVYFYVPLTMVTLKQSPIR